MEAGVITRSELSEVMTVASVHRIHVGQVLISQGRLDRNDLINAISAQSAIKDRTCDFRTGITALRQAFKSGITFSEALKGQSFQSWWASSTNKLGELLLEAGLITKQQFHDALEESLKTGLPLGRCLIITGAISEALLEVSLELQIRIRDEMIGRREAIEALKQGAFERPVLPGEYRKLAKEARRHVIRMGELLVSADVLKPEQVLEAQEQAIDSNQKIGQILLAKRWIEENVLEAALSLQQMTDSKFLTEQKAAQCLKYVHKEKVSVSQAMVDMGLVRRRRFTTLGEIDPVTVTEKALARKKNGQSRADVAKASAGMPEERVFTRDFSEKIEFCRALSSAYTTLGEVALSTGDYEGASEHYGRVLDILEGIHGTNSPELLNSLLNLATARALLGRLARAEELLERAVTIVDRCVPVNPRMLTACLSSLANVYVQLGRMDEAEPLLSRALAVESLHFTGATTDEIIRLLKDYARLLVKTDRPQEAEKLYCQARAAF